MDKAYANQSKFYIDEFRGQKILVVKGSVSAEDHVKNAIALTGKVYEKVANAVTGKRHDVDLLNYLRQDAAQIDIAVRIFKPHLVVGHSRGAAVMSYMEEKDTPLLGVDGAMIIGGNTENIFNLYSKPKPTEVATELATAAVAGEAAKAVIAATVGGLPGIAAIEAARLYQTVNFWQAMGIQNIDTVLNIDHEGDSFAVEQVNKNAGHSVFNDAKDVEKGEVVRTHHGNQLDQN